jgi:hypothetical protein
MVLALGAIASCAVYVNGFCPEGKEYEALDQSGKVARACDAYRLKTLANGKYPARLLDLIEPPAGMQPVLDGGRSALISPWGKEYKFGTVETEDGPALYVWTEFEADGKVTLIGSKHGPKGRRTFFGRPD